MSSLLIETGALCFVRESLLLGLALLLFQNFQLPVGFGGSLIRLQRGQTLRLCFGQRLPLRFRIPLLDLFSPVRQFVFGPFLVGLIAVRQCHHADDKNENDRKFLHDDLKPRQRLLCEVRTLPRHQSIGGIEFGNSATPGCAAFAAASGKAHESAFCSGWFFRKIEKISAANSTSPEPVGEIS